MPRQKGLFFFTHLLAFIVSLTLALPPGTPWSNFVSKPVYSRALGPPSGIDTISVPYMPKSPFFPKFVDPKMLISKKTDMLSNLFGGLGPVAYNMADTKPIMSYGISKASLDSTNSANTLFNKQDTLPDSKEKTIDSSGMYKRGMFGPFTSKFGPINPMNPMNQMSPTIRPVMSFLSPEMMPDYMSKTPFSRKRRSIETSSPADDINSISDPSSYSKDSHIVENTSTTKSAASEAPKEYLPGMFGPFGLSGSFGPVVDPSVFMAKKSAFLDTLFKNLATSTPATTTDASTPKSTIVPPDFWIPSSAIASPTEYTSKVLDFLNKLFDNIKLNVTAEETSDDSDAKSDFMRSLKPNDILPDKTARSLDDALSIATAKDAIVDMILSELGDIKSDMLATLNDLIAYEKTAAATTATAKKPFKPFSGMFPFAKPTMDPTLPFKQRMTVLSQVFDMLTNLQRNITMAAAKSATTANTDTLSNQELPKIPLAADNTVGASSINNTFLDAILKKISGFETTTPTSYSAAYPVNLIKENMMSRALPKGPTSFWVSYPENSASAVKRQVEDDLPYLEYENDNDQHDHRQYTRGVKMQMHQGYQSLPAGSIESVQAGGGSTPGHQGGGIKLLGSNAYENLDKWTDRMEYHKNEYQDHRHHHNHH